MEKVYLYKETEYTEQSMDALAEKLFAPYGGVKGLLNGKRRVLIKPNLVAKKPLDTGTTTHPLMLRAICKALLAEGAEVTVAESHGGPYTTATAKGQFSGCGITEAVKDLDVSLYTEAESAHISYPDGLIAKSFEVIKPIAETDFIINLCKLKTHALTTYSGAAKNTFGAIPGMRKFELHARFTDIHHFTRMLNDLHLALPVGLNVVDGILGMEGNGPTAGIPKKYGFVAVGKSAFLTDLICADLIGLDSAEVPQLKDAAERSLCPNKGGYEHTNLSREEYEGLRCADTTLPDSHSAGAVSWIARVQRMGGGRVIKLFRPKPKVKKSRCVGCGKCAEYCPVHTIEMKKGKPRIIRDKCIHCFCCQELCPISAIYIKTNRILKI